MRWATFLLFSVALATTLFCGSISLASDDGKPAPPYLSFGIKRSKHISLGDESYVALGGELRERTEYYLAFGFGLDGQGKELYLLHRLMLSALFFLGNSLEVFMEVGNHLQNGKVKPLLSTHVDKGDLQQGYMNLSVTGIASTLRVGRQEVSFGTRRLISLREARNVRRSFDGFRLSLTGIENTTVDVVALRPVALKKGYFDDKADGNQSLWGVYGTAMSKPGIGVDAYYLGYANENARYIGVAGREVRHSIGTRIFGSANGLDWNAEIIGQLGTVAQQNILAWAFSSDAGYAVAGLPWSPRLGIKTVLASGDNADTDRQQKTFHPLFSRLGLNEAGLIYSANIADFQPTFSVSPVKGLNIVTSWEFVWRQTLADAIYTGPGAPVTGTAGNAGRFIGKQFGIESVWRDGAHLEIKSSYAHFQPGSALKAAGGRNNDYAMFSVAYRF